MKQSRIYIVALACLLLSAGHAQEAELRRADREYRDLAYVRTSEILLEVANKGYRSVDLFQKLGNSFYFRNRMEEAAKWYGELMGMTQDVEREYMFRYAQALKALSDYEGSDEWMRRFHRANREDLRGRAFANNVDYLSDIEAKSLDFGVENMGINTELSEFGAVQYKDMLVFASTRGGGREYQWNQQPFLDLYSVTKGAEGTYGSDAEAFDEGLNTRFHESTATFTSDDSTVYFTRNNYLGRRLKKDDGGTTRLKVYRAALQGDGSWGDAEPLVINNDAYSVAHPTVNAAGTRLYFASDMPGSFGSSDIFMAEIEEDGTVGKPVNLGSLVNTEAHESFPYVNSVGDLYYSSDGRAGLGGLDVYVIRDFENKLEGEMPIATENLGRPINSNMDDFGYYENLATREGFFTSNRSGGKGDDDIYSFTLPECEQTVEGTVRDRDDLEPLAGATVTLLDGDGGELQSATTAADGSYLFTIACEEEYLVRGEKELYLTDEKRFTSPRSKQELVLDLLLARDRVAVGEETNLREALDLNPIYFDLDKSDIRPDAEVELQKVIAVLEKYPQISIDVRSHTDSRAGDAYNMALSERRNRSTIRYIVERGGIARDRLTGRGYGETQLLNDCTNGADCTEAEHQLNRRSDFVVTGL